VPTLQLKIYRQYFGSERASMTTATVSDVRSEVGRGFYLTMFLIMVAILVAGFSQTVPGDFSSKRGLPLLLHVHGAVFTSWVAIMVLQPSLIVGGDVRRHIQIGAIGTFIAGSMVVMGVTATLVAISQHLVPSFFPKTIFLVQNVLGILVFGVLVTAAFAFRRNVEWHKRLMYCACASIIGPGLGRFLPMDQFGKAAPLVLYAVNDLVLLAGPVADLIVRRRVHPAYVWGVSAVILWQVAIVPLAFSAPAAWAVRAIGG
jgi:hypothetical protein